MRKLITLILALSLSAPCFGQMPVRRRSKKQWVLSAAALIAANVLDARSSLGRRELNPFLRNSRGEFSSGRAVAMKSAGLGGVLTLELFLMRDKPELARTSSIVNFVTAGAMTAAAINNTR